MSKRKKYRPGPVMFMPPTWATTRTAIVNLGLRERQAATALLAGAGVEEDYLALEAACEAAIWACEAAKVFDFDADALAQLHARLMHCARELLALRDSAAELGRYECTPTQREALAELCDLMEDMRQQVPRRCWLQGYAKSLSGAGIPVPR